MRSLPRVQESACLGGFHLFGRNLPHNRVAVGIPLSGPVHIVKTHRSIVSRIQSPAVTSDTHKVIEDRSIPFATILPDVGSQIEVRQRVRNVGRHLVLNRNGVPSGTDLIPHTVVLTPIQVNQKIWGRMTQ